MQKIYEVEGILNKGFVGQISYTVCLDKPYKEMDIVFSFDKQRYTEVTEEVKEEVRNSCKGIYDSAIATKEQLEDAIKEMKTEIHTIVTMNDEFIGGVHKQLTNRHMTFSPDYTSEGCIEQETIDGVIKITLVVFNVILNGTHYNLSLSVNE